MSGQAIELDDLKSKGGSAPPRVKTETSLASEFDSKCGRFEYCGEVFKHEIHWTEWVFIISCIAAAIMLLLVLVAGTKIPSPVFSITTMVVACVAAFFLWGYAKTRTLAALARNLKSLVAQAKQNTKYHQENNRVLAAENDKIQQSLAEFKNSVGLVDSAIKDIDAVEAKLNDLLRKHQALMDEQKRFDEEHAAFLNMQEANRLHLKVEQAKSRVRDQFSYADMNRDGTISTPKEREKMKEYVEKAGFKWPSEWDLETGPGVRLYALMAALDQQTDSVFSFSRILAVEAEIKQLTAEKEERTKELHAILKEKGIDASDVKIGIHAGESKQATPALTKPAANMALTYPLAAAFFVAALLAARSYLLWGWAGSLSLSLVAAYLPSYFDGSEYTANGRYWKWFASHAFWKDTVAAWFPMSIRYSVPLEKRRYLISTHPHGAISWHHGMTMTNCCDFYDVCPMTERRDIGATVVFKIPLYRDFLLWLGVVDAGAATCHRVLKSGKSLGVLVGGESEQLLGRPGEHTVFIRKRKGFCKLALQYGLPVLPGYAFGETELYSVSRFLFGARYWLMQNLRVALPIFWGSAWWCPLVPRKVPIVLCFGKPIEVEQVKEPTPQQIDALHAQYIAELERVFDANKAALGYADAKLKIL